MTDEEESVVPAGSVTLECFRHVLENDGFQKGLVETCGGKLLRLIKREPVTVDSGNDPFPVI
jgi:hypothetical protein